MLLIDVIRHLDSCLNFRICHRNLSSVVDVYTRPFQRVFFPALFWEMISVIPNLIFFSEHRTMGPLSG